MLKEFLMKAIEALREKLYDAMNSGDSKDILEASMKLDDEIVRYILKHSPLTGRENCLS
jgi:hypothetical protein